MKKLLLIFLLIINCSCSTIHVKKDYGFGYPYQGLEKAAKEGVLNTGIVLIMATPAVVIIIPYYTVDIVSSSVADTLVLPIDLMIKNDKPRQLRVHSFLDGP